MQIKEEYSWDNATCIVKKPESLQMRNLLLQPASRVLRRYPGTTRRKKKIISPPLASDL